MFHSEAQILCGRHLLCKRHASLNFKDVYWKSEKMFLEVHSLNPIIIIKPLFSLGQVNFQGWKKCQWGGIFFLNGLHHLNFGLERSRTIEATWDHTLTGLPLESALAPKSSDWRVCPRTTKKKLTSSLHCASVESQPWENTPAPKASRGPGSVSHSGWWAARGRWAGLSFTPSSPGPIFCSSYVRCSESFSFWSSDPASCTSQDAHQFSLGQTVRRSWMHKQGV